MVKGYSLSSKGMTLHSYIPTDNKGIVAFPYGMDITVIEAFVWGWLKSQDAKACLPKSSGCDGSEEPTGFSITTAHCYFDKIATFCPAWEEYHK